MAYQALYRQWRPKDFSSMVAQEAVISTLRNQVMSGRVAHAYLFCGSRGTGKTSTAKILARAINCEHPVGGDPCGQCESCRRLLADESMDVMEIDAASNNGVEEIRNLRETVKYPPQQGKYKVYIIDEVHMLSTSAFNALLKTLEEPPAYVVFILATTEPQKLPATILSRCQRFDFGRIPARQIAGRLRQAAEGAKAEASENALMLIARAAEGGMRDALSILDMCLGYSNQVTEDLVRNVLGTSDRSFLFRFVTQQNQFLLSEGVSLPEETKKRLGADFDHLLSRLGECALLHGVSYGYWNADHLEIIEMARAAGSGFFPLLDEMTGELMLGVQFWQLGAKRPMFLRLFEQDGVTILRVSGKQVDVVREKTAYVRTLRRDALGDTLDVERQGYGRLPLIPLYANQEGKSELTPAIQAKIDAYDNILSDFADNLARANDVYWVLNNFSGTTEDIAEMLEEISRIKAVANLSDGSGSGATAEPHTIEVPYAARQAALNLLERALYNDYMALDMASLTGGSLTNVAIRAAMANLNLKADRYEWQVRHFMQELLTLLHLETEEIHFKRQAIANESELVADIQNMRQDIDQRTALRLNPYIADEEIGGLVKGAGNPV